MKKKRRREVSREEDIQKEKVGRIKQVKKVGEGGGGEEEKYRKKRGKIYRKISSSEGRRSE